VGLNLIQLILDGNGVKAMPQDLFLHPILVHSIVEKKENIGSKMGHTKKSFNKKIDRGSTLTIVQNKLGNLKQIMFNSWF